MYELDEIQVGNRIKMIAEINEMSVTEVMVKATVTMMATVVKPRLKDYDVYLMETGRIKGVTIRNKIAGRKPWKDGTHGITDHINNMFEEYELEVINEDFFSHTLELIDRALKSIYDGNHGLKVKEIYDVALSHPNFLYSMLQIGVRLLGQRLQDKNIELKNKTLDHILQEIKKKRNRIEELFKSVRTAEDLKQALIVYYDEINVYFDEFLDRDVTEGTKWKSALEIAGEKAMLDQVGEDNVLYFIGQIIFKIQERFMINIPLIRPEAITMK